MRSRDVFSDEGLPDEALLDEGLPDEALMAAFQTGDLASFERLYDRYERRLWLFVRRYLANPQTADDILQETFLRVVQHKDQWAAGTHFAPWLFRIARNLCTDHARRAAHRQTTSLEGARAAGRDGDASGPILLETIAGPPSKSDPEHLAQQQEALRQLDAALQQIPDVQREVFLLRELAGLSFQEVAAAVGAEINTTKSRMRYALEALRTALAPAGLAPDKAAVRSHP